jgi:hypothetical protein
MKTLLLCFLTSLSIITSLAADPSPTVELKSSATASLAAPQDYVLMHFILKHDQSRNLAELTQVMKENKFWIEFPPEGIEIDSWYVVIGVGQVVTLRVPPARLREVNLAIERSAWKAFRTEAYAAYDLKQAAQSFREKAKAEAAAASPKH